METITVTKLNGAYDQCSGLVNLIAGDGEKLLSDLSTTINNLKGNWVGRDATVHINGLIVVYKAMHAILSEAKGSVAYAADRVIEMQRVRNANGGGGNIGEPVSGDEIAKVDIAENEFTEEYRVEPGAADDLEALKDECTRYDEFVKKFLEQKDELMSNWTAGAQRSKAVEAFGNLEENSSAYKKLLNDARDNLETAVKNIQTLEG